jgi:hypothetical protein
MAAPRHARATEDEKRARAILNEEMETLGWTNAKVREILSELNHYLHPSVGDRTYVAPNQAICVDCDRPAIPGENRCLTHHAK